SVLFISAEKSRGHLMEAVAQLALVSQKLTEQILLIEILIGLLGHDGGAREPVAQPVEAALNHPLQDLTMLVSQALLERAIDVGRLMTERNDVESPAHGVVNIVEIWLVVTGN